jgi:predicted Zn finger-like uncharacterized protein
MRLVCPNCGAQYEVDTGAIPEDGRDVQCSNCGHTWFQPPAGQDAGLADELGMTAPAQSAPPTHPAPPVPAEPEPASPAPDAEASGKHMRRALDPGVRDILREEAERESTARDGDDNTLETQPDLGLDSPGQDDTDTLNRRMARLRGSDLPEESGSGAGKRRDLLPDIEEINSSLRATSEREAEVPAAPDSATDTSAQRGFRTGFGLMMILTAALIGLYAYAEALAGMVPQAQPALSGFVNIANGLRDWLDLVMQGTATRLAELLEQVSGD